MARWTAFPQLGEFTYDARSVRDAWARLHAGDAEPLPEDPRALEAWALFHNGDFEQAVQAGLDAGGSGITAANKAACIYATYLEKKEKTRLDLLQEAAARARAQAQAQPHHANAWYLQAVALGRYSQAISVAKALAQGLGSQVRDALGQAIALQPRHAEAHLALGSFHAEVIDKVGTLIGGMTYGARKDVALQMFREAQRLHPDSPIGLIEQARGLLMLEGERQAAEATRLYQQAAAIVPLDAMQRLEVELARLELRD